MRLGDPIDDFKFVKMKNRKEYMCLGLHEGNMCETFRKFVFAEAS